MVDVASGEIVEALTDPALFAVTADWNTVTGEIIYSALPEPTAIGPDLFAVQPDGSEPRRLTVVASEGHGACVRTFGQS